jgi:hypothetical protein
MLLDVIQAIPRGYFNLQGKVSDQFPSVMENSNCVLPGMLLSWCAHRSTKALSMLHDWPSMIAIWSPLEDTFEMIETLGECCRV